MLQATFSWFYCLSIKDVVLLMIAVSAVFLMLRRFLGKTRFWRVAIALLFSAWFMVTVTSTLICRKPEINAGEPQLIPFHSYRAVRSGGNKELLRSNFMNIVLFYPAGLLLFELLPRSRKRITRIFIVVGLLAAMSAVIEICQYRYALGVAEMDDVMHNTIGAFLGALVCCFRIKRRRKAELPHD